MEVHFYRTGERRYAVTIDRKDRPPVEMNPAPGFDPLIPHDLMHLIVEIELGLSRAIFGQVAKGGHAGTFRRLASAASNPREATRLLRRTSKRGDRLLREGREECLQSERATYICWYEWLARSKDPQRRKRANEMALNAKHVRGTLPRSEANALNEDLITRVCARLDDLSAHWSTLRIGESVTVEWPEHLRHVRSI